MVNFGKTLIFIGIGVVVLGAVLWLSSRLGIGLGKLPGDLSYQKDESSFYFPIVTCIIISIILSVLLNLFFWFKK